MKTKLFLLSLALASGAVPPVFAGPPPLFFETLRREQQFRDLKPADQIVYVCKECQSVTAQTVGASPAPMDYCKEGSTVTCPSCRKSFRVVMRGQPKHATPVREVIYTNAKGQPCLFIAKVGPAPQTP